MIRSLIALVVFAMISVEASAVALRPLPLPDCTDKKCGVRPLPLPDCTDKKCGAPVE